MTLDNNGNWLRSELSKRLITQDELSQHTGIAQSRISRLCQLVDNEALFSKMYVSEYHKIQFYLDSYVDEIDLQKVLV